MTSEGPDKTIEKIYLGTHRLYDTKIYDSVISAFYPTSISTL